MKSCIPKWIIHTLIFLQILDLESSIAGRRNGGVESNQILIWLSKYLGANESLIAVKSILIVILVASLGSVSKLPERLRVIMCTGYIFTSLYYAFVVVINFNISLEKIGV